MSRTRAARASAWHLLAADLTPRVRWGTGALVALNAMATGGLGWQLGRMVDQPGYGAVVALAAWLALRCATWLGALLVWQPGVERACGRWRVRLLGRALGQRIDVLGETSAGELADRIDDDTATTARTLAHAGLLAGSAVCTAVVALVVAGTTAPWTIPGFLATAVAVVVVTGRLGPPVARAREHVEVGWTDLAITVEEAVAARDDVRASRGRAHVLDRYGRAVREVLDREVVAAVGRANLHVAVAAVFAAAVCLAVVGSVWATLEAGLSVAGAVTVVTLTLSFAGQLRMMTNNYPQLVEGLAAARRVVALAQVPVEAAGAHEVSFDADDTSVRFADVTFRYGPDLPEVLHGVSLEVPSGRTCGLVGRTGSGKSTMVALLTRAVDTPRGAVFLGGVDVCDLDVATLRSAVGVVAQRTELLAASVHENVSLFAPVDRAQVAAAFDELGLADWVASLPDGLDTRIGPGGLTLSSGEEQLVAFARLLVRHPAVVVLDEATARMDPVTDARVARAASRLLAGRTGLVIAHRLATLRSCDELAVLSAGRVVEHGPRAELVHAGGHLGELVAASGLDRAWLAGDASEEPSAVSAAAERRAPSADPGPLVGGPRPETWHPPVWRTVARLLGTDRSNGLGSLARWGVAIAFGYAGIVANTAWGHIVVDLEAGQWPSVALAVFVLSALLGLVIERGAHLRYPHWWVQGECRLRAAIVAGQVDRYRTRRRPPGEVVARAFGTERVMELADNSADVVLFTLAAVIPTAALLGGIPGLVALATMVVPFTAAFAVRGRTRRRALATADARAASAVLLGSAVDAARTVKLFAGVDDVVVAYAALDRQRVAAAVRESRQRAWLDFTAGGATAAAIAAIWLARAAGSVDLEAALATTATITAMAYGAWVAQAIVANAAAARAWLEQAAPLAQTDDLVTLPAEVVLDEAAAPVPEPVVAVPLDVLEVHDLAVVHDDGTVGVEGCSFEVKAGQLVLVVGEVGSGKSSLLGAVAGLHAHRGEITWNGRSVDDPEVFLRPGQVAWVGQVPRVLSGTFADNVALGHGYDVDDAVAAACLSVDVLRAGGATAVVGHRGVRLSGGQVQRLALARALAAGTELVVADDVSSALDAGTEVDVWASLRERGCAVLATSGKLAAAERADRVVVLEQGRQVASGPWSLLADRYRHLVA